MNPVTGTPLVIGEAEREALYRLRVYAVDHALDMSTLADDSPIMIKVNEIWNRQTTYAERKAYVEVTLHNSRAVEDLRLATSVFAKISGAFGSQLG